MNVYSALNGMSGMSGYRVCTCVHISIPVTRILKLNMKYQRDIEDRRGTVLFSSFILNNGGLFTDFFWDLNFRHCSPQEQQKSGEKGGDRKRESPVAIYR